MSLLPELSEFFFGINEFEPELSDLAFFVGD